MIDDYPQQIATKQILQQLNPQRAHTRGQQTKEKNLQVPSSIGLQLPKIPLIRRNQQSFKDISIKNKMNKVLLILQQKRYQPVHSTVKRISKNNSLSQHSANKLEQLEKIKQFKNSTTLAKYNKKQVYANVMPRIYEHIQKQRQRRIIDELPRLRPGSLIPELQSSKVLDNYKVISHVGKGCFSVVSAAVDKTNNKKFAIKTYNRIDQMDDVRLKSIQSQVQNLFSLHHNNIIQLKHAVKDGRKIQLIMQNGGQQSLSGLLRKTTSFGEITAKRYFRQMIQAMAYCHSNNICHRDIKLENILVDQKDQIKIIDFGFSLKCNNKMRLTSFCGTPPYMSPQLASRSPYNGLTSDVWALGVSLYLMLTGKFPFKAANQKQLYRIIQQGKYKTQNLSQQVKILLESMLKIDQKARITAQEIMKSDWLKTQQFSVK